MQTIDGRSMHDGDFPPLNTNSKNLNVHKVADHFSLGARIVETSLKLDSGIAGIIRNSLNPQFNFLNTLVVSHSLSLQDVDRALLEWTEASFKVADQFLLGEQNTGTEPPLDSGSEG